MIGHHAERGQGRIAKAVTDSGGQETALPFPCLVSAARAENGSVGSDLPPAEKSAAPQACSSLPVPKRSAESGSLSMSHNYNEQRELPFRLTGSQKKTAYALEQNVACMIEEAGLEFCGFLTLTVGDEEEDGFRQVWDAAEASRRIKSLENGLLADLFPRSIIVTERHKSGAIHFHLIVECREDIRTGFDFASFLAARTARKEGWVNEEAEREYQASASDHLRALWGILRERLPAYGFGRSELTPIFKTGEAISRYVSKYVEKNLFNRLAEDKGKKLVRYMGWKGQQMTANGFSWATPAACEWRKNAAALAKTQGVLHREEVALCFGPRWAFRLSRAMQDADYVLTRRCHAEDARELIVDFVRREVVFPQWRSWLEDERREEEGLPLRAQSWGPLETWPRELEALAA